MAVGNFTESTVLLIAHGSTVNTDSASSGLQHAEALNATRMFAEVKVAFWKQSPHIRDVLGRIETPNIFAVPLFLSDGYFTRHVLPQELGFGALDDRRIPRVKTLGRRTLFYCEPIGTSPVMTDVVLARVEKTLRADQDTPKDSQIALLLAAHGTERDPNSGRAADWHVERIREMNRFAEAHASFLEEAPRIADFPALIRSEHVVAVPFFISEGLHAREDVPVLLGESPDDVRRRIRTGQPTFINPTERFGKRIWYTQSVGTAFQVRDVILQRVREAARWKV